MSRRIDALESSFIRWTMRVRPPSWTIYRAVIAVAALYALVLQGILGSSLLAGTVDPAAVPCLKNAGTSPDGPEKAPTAHKHLNCCTAAHITPAAVPPALMSSSVIWPSRRAVRIAWRPEVVAAPRAPPGVSASARAPPVA